MRPLIFDIARGSYEDGPGLRTVVFFKGCPLKCAWCQNPESQNPEPELMFYPERCIKCGNCAVQCYTRARQTVGQYYSPETLTKLIARDKLFYETSSGGVTFSGGEPLLHTQYLSCVCPLLKGENIHMAVETCGFFDYETFRNSILPYIDLYLFDVKIMDPVKHIEFTGKSNELILRNLLNLIEAGKNVIVRTPLIPGITGSEENLSQIREFLVCHRIEKHVLLPYNPGGEEKMKFLGVRQDFSL